jgi:16S rRNA (cytosine967-C5)-methyltransferase
MQSALELDGRKSELRELLAANNQIPIVNLIAITSAASAKLDELGLERGSASPRGYLATGNPLKYLTIPGVRVQDQGSQLVALALSAVADKSGTWLDMCSGPGGKAAVLEDAVSGSGHLVCYEPHVKRAKLVTAALKDPENTPVLVNRGQDASENSFEAVLLDAPCAGLGSLRRKPESRWTKTPEQLPSLTKLQSELLDAAVLALEPGGLLMYATCSPLIVETNAQIRAVLDRHANISLVDLVPVMQKLSPGLELNSARKTIQLWPHRHGTDAMFMALLKKDDGT